MSQDDAEVQEFVRERSQRMMRSALLVRVRGIANLWQREEQGKSRVVRGAVRGALLLVAFTALVAMWEPAYSPHAFLAGFLAWVAYFVVLIGRHLGTRR